MRSEATQKPERVWLLPLARELRPVRSLTIGLTRMRSSMAARLIAALHETRRIEAARIVRKFRHLMEN